MTERDLDVVVFGATGVTGRRVAAYLAERTAGTGTRWGAAARDRAKLERTLADDGITGRGGVAAPETLIADVGDAASLAAMASRAKVVLDLVGPYTLYGRPVIEACVAAGAHYVDLTGEIPFVRQVIDEVHDRAVDKGVKVVQVCGFECLPPDLAVTLAGETARRRWDEGLAEVDLEVSWTLPPGRPRPSDTISGGTFQSLTAVAGAEGDTSNVTDPAALVTDPAVAQEVRRRSPIRVRPRRGTRGAPVAPMAPAAFINPAVIQRSAFLLAADRPDAVPFAYREGIALAGSARSAPFRYAGAAALSGVQLGLMRMATAPASVRRRAGGMLSAVLPSSGFGPDADRLEGWRWQMSVRALTAGGRELDVVVDAEGHPGYLATARMLGEAGLLLAEPGATTDRAGCLTPATALGTGCLDRFEHARLRFSVTA